MLTLQTALNAIKLHSNSNTLTVAQLQTALGTSSVTFANITSVTQVKTAAAHKELNIQKVTVANVILASKLKAFTSIYANRVKKTAANIAGNDATAIENFIPQSTYFSHTSCYSIVKHNRIDKYYLYAMYNNADSVYVIDNVIVTKQEVAQYLTASAAKALLKTSNTVTNKAQGVEHAATIRTIGLANLVSINVNKQQLAV